MEVGRRIYYDKLTGNVIIDTGEREGLVLTKTIEQEVTTFNELSIRNRDSFGVIELPYGAYKQDFVESRGNYRVNPETGSLEFSYPDPNNPEEPQPFSPPLSDEVIRLTNENKAQDQVIEELMFVIIPELSGGGI